MFGIVKNNLQIDQVGINNFQTNTCSICKSIGSIYGNSFRLFLNTDITYLNELLIDLAKKKPDADNNFSFNCLSLPIETEIDITQRYLSFINILFAKYKLLDNISDSKGVKHFGWNKVNTFFNFDSSILNNEIKRFEFPITKIDELIKEQDKRERIKNKSIEFYSHTTSELTGIVIKHAMCKIEKNEFENLAYKFGYYFGRIVYISDAIMDFKSDKQNSRFNAIQETFSRHKSKKTYSLIRKDLELSLSTLIDILEKFPINKKQKNKHTNKLCNSLIPIYENLATLFKDKNKESYFNFIDIKSYYSLVLSKAKLTYLLLSYLFLPKGLFAKFNNFDDHIIHKADCQEDVCGLICCYIIANWCCGSDNSSDNSSSSPSLPSNVSGGIMVCPGCNGSGCYKCSWSGTQKADKGGTIIKCPKCNGSGCWSCNFDGTQKS